MEYFEVCYNLLFTCKQPCNLEEYVFDFSINSNLINIWKLKLKHNMAYHTSEETVGFD